MTRFVRASTLALFSAALLSTPAWAAPARSFPRITDADETIYAVQRKAYLVKGALEVTPMAAMLISDRFVDSYAPALSLSYHLAENFAVEAFGAYMFSSPSSVTTEVLQRGQLSPELAKSTELRWAAGLGVQWSPVYGKVELWGRHLGTFNFYLSAGAALGQSRAPCTAGEALDGGGQCPAAGLNAAETLYAPSEFRPMGVFGAGLRFYLSRRIGLKLELKDYVYSARVYRPDAAEGTQLTDAIRNNVFAQIGVSFLFGGEEE